MSPAPGYVHVVKWACVRGIAGIAELELALKASLGMSEQYGPLAGRVACPAHAHDRGIFPSSSKAHARCRGEIGRPKGQRTDTTTDTGTFSNQDAEWLSCSELPNQIDLQAKSRSGGMADAADSKSVGRKPVKVRLLSPAPTSIHRQEIFGKRSSPVNGAEANGAQLTLGGDGWRRSPGPPLSLRPR